MNWHSSAVTRRPPGSWEPGRCLAFAEGRRKLHRARSLIRPRSRLLCALTCKFGQVYHLAGSLVSGFKVKEIEKTFGLPQATGFR